MYQKCVSFSGTLMRQLFCDIKFKCIYSTETHFLYILSCGFIKSVPIISKSMLKNCQTSYLQIKTSFNCFHASVQVWPLAEQEDLVQKITQIALTYLPITRKRSRQPPNFFSFSDSQIVRGHSCAISDFSVVNEKSAI